MLHVKTKVAPSAVDGLGLFAAEPIPKGTLVAKWNPAFDSSFTDEEIARLPDLARTFLDRYAWRAKDGTWHVSLDDSRYTNHSLTPNLVVDETTEGWESRAARDIAPGEELLEDYSTYDEDFPSYGAGWR